MLDETEIVPTENVRQEILASSRGLLAILVPEITRSRQAFDRHLKEAKVSWVYFFKSGNYLKIGKAIDVAARREQLQAMNPEPLLLVLAVQGGILLETALHNRFADRKLHGEWFSIDDDLMRFLWELAQALRWVQLDNIEGNPIFEVEE